MGKYFDYEPPKSALDLSTGLSSVGDALTDVLNRRQKKQQFDEQRALVQQHEQREQGQFQANMDLQRDIDTRRTNAEAAREQRTERKDAGEAKLKAGGYLAQGDVDSAKIAMSTVGGQLIPGEMPDVGPEPQAPVAPQAPAGVPPEIAARRRGQTLTSEDPAQMKYRTKGVPAGRYEGQDPIIPGLAESGNIDLAHRPRHHNPDGSVSTVRSMSFSEGGPEILVPTIADDGTPLTDEQAIDLYHQTGKHLGKFKTVEHADAYAQRLHEDQARQYRIYNPETQGARYQATSDMIAEDQARQDQGLYDKDKAKFDTESAAFPGRQADYQRARAEAENQRPYTLAMGDKDPNAATVTLGGLRHGGRAMAAQDFLDSLNTVQLSPEEKAAAARAQAAILAGSDPKTAIAAFQKERLLGQTQNWKHGENQFHEAEADKRASMMAGFKGAQASLDRVRADEARASGNRMDQGELRRDFSDWESKVAGLPLDAKAYKRLEFVTQNINSGNPLQQREAAEGLVGFFRGGVVTGAAQKFLLSHLSGLGGQAETAMEHIQSGRYGEQDLAVLQQAAHNAMAEQKDQVMRHYKSAQVRYGQGSGFEGLGSQVNAKVQGTLREFGVDVPPIYPDAAPAIPLGSTVRPYQGKPRTRPPGAPPEVKAKDKAKDSALDEAMQ